MRVGDRTDGRAEIDLSPMWTASIVAAVAIALSLAGTATVLTVRSLRPIGEGELLSADARRVGRQVEAAGDDITAELRHMRNQLEIEAVGLVDEEGRVVEATSPSLAAGRPVDRMLQSALGRGVFSAVAAPLDVPVTVDGVVEWAAGSVLYQAVQPLEGGGGVLLVYDISEMLERRAEASRVPTVVLPLGAGSGLFLLAAGLLSAARSRAARIRRVLSLEAEFLRRQTSDLQRHNAELEAARAETQRALDLAEEKNRIRAEFVLMINHELRTPLTGVVTGARLLASSETLSDIDRAVLKDVVADGERLDALIGQMLAVARVENRGLSATPKPQPLVGLVERLGAAHRLAPVRVTETVDPDTTVTTDATTMSQLVASLVDNAHTHGASRTEIVVTDDIPERVDHEIGVRPDHANYVLVIDDGPGIDHDFLPRAFEKFEKASFSAGTGLGLYMARMMVESIGSSLSVMTSRRGTVMAVGIPASVHLERVA